MSAVANSLDKNANAELRTLDDAALMRAIIADDQAAWRELVNRFSVALRNAVIESGRVAVADVDDVISELWLMLIENDKQRLRSFDSSRGTPLLTWLSIRLLQIVARRWGEEIDAPEMVSIDKVKNLDDSNRAQPRIFRPSTLMKVEEVAERWDLNVKTIYSMIARGELISRRCGRVIRIPRYVVESFERASVLPGRK